MPKPCAVCKGKPVYFHRLCVDCLSKAHDDYVNKMTNPAPYNPDTEPEEQVRNIYPCGER